MKYTAHEHLVPFTTVAPQVVGAAEVNGAGVDKIEAREALVHLYAKDTTGSLQVKFEHSDDDVTYVQYDGPIGPAGSGLSAAISAPGDYVGRVDLEGAKPYVRCSLIGTNAADEGSVALTLLSERLVPVKQVNALLFNVQ